MKSDFGTESDNCSHGREADDNYSGSNSMSTCNTAVPLVNTQDTIMSSDRSSDDHFESDGEEIWEDSCPEIDSDREDTNIMTNDLAKRILLGILTFITSFQLSFHASERAMSALLLFLKTFITYLANIINHPTLVELQQIFPVTMAKARKLIGMSTNDGVIVFSVCPKCNTLYKSSDCILWEGSKEEPK